jgi:DNA polymerase-3 subunit epsilon
VRQIHEEIFICLDCESTGLDPTQDRIIELAGALFMFEKILHQMESLINPDCDIPKTSQDIHKISQEMIIDKPKIKDILPTFLKMIDGHILVGHGIGFDIALIAAEAQRNQIPCKIQEAPYIDTLRLARLYGESPVNSLAKLRQHFNIEEQGAHRAMSDVLVNIEVFKYLARPYKTTDMIFKTLAKPIKLRAMPLGKHKGRRFEEIPLEYLLWAERKDFDQDLLYSIRLELRNRKKGGSFEQSTNPFSQLM